MLRNIRRIILLLLIASVITFSVLAGSIYQFSKKNNDISTDAVIVLGASVKNAKPSPVFLARINHAISLYKNKKIKILIFTGGVGLNEKLAEAEVARKIALDAGVPYEKIYIDQISTSTRENLIEAHKIIKKFKIESTLIVSDPLHMKRAMAIAIEIGIPAYSSPTQTSEIKSWGNKSKMLFRETYYYIGFLYSSVFNKSIFRLANSE